MFQKKSTHSCFWSRCTQHFVCTLPGICHLLTLPWEMLCSDPVLISGEKLMNDTSAKTLCKAEQKHISGKVSWANSLWKKKWDQIFLCKFWSSPIHLGSFHKVLHFYCWVCDRQLRPLTALSVSLFLIPMYTPDVLPGLLLIAVWSPFLNMAFRTPDYVLLPRKQVNACHSLEERTIFQDYLFVLFCGEIHNTIEWDI